MSYIACRSIRVHMPDGSVQTRAPGDPVPEAAGWANPRAWCNRGWIRYVGEGLPPVGVDRGKMRPPRAVTSEDLLKRGLSSPVMPASDMVMPNDPPAPDQPLSAGVVFTENDLGAMKKTELLELAESMGLGLTHHSAKDEIVSMILDAQRTAG